MYVEGFQVYEGGVVLRFLVVTAWSMRGRPFVFEKRSRVLWRSVSA